VKFVNGEMIDVAGLCNLFKMLFDFVRVDFLCQV